MIQRTEITDIIESSIERFPVVALLGPRQSGKTTLARKIFAQLSDEEITELNYLDLEDPTTLNRLSDPKLALEPLRGLVVIDEVQRLPDISPLLRVLADRPHRPATFLILGSASRELLRQTSESLAGRIKYVDVMPISVSELGIADMDKHWLRGGYAPSLLSDSDSHSDDWRAQYIRTFLEQDLRVMGVDVPPIKMRRLWMMLCHFHGQILNTSEIAQSLDISDSTAKKYIDILCHTFMLRRLHPWFENIGKRQVKSPKIYFRDSGLLHHLLGIKTREQLLTNPVLGRSWEGYVLEQFVRKRGAVNEDCHFWAVHSQGELDLLIGHGSNREAFEIKYSMSPTVTPSMNLAIEMLKLKKLTIIYPGKVDFALSPQIKVVAAANALQQSLRE